MKAGSLDHALVAAAGFLGILSMSPSEQTKDQSDSSDPEKTLSTFQLVRMLSFGTF